MTPWREWPGLQLTWWKTMAQARGTHSVGALYLGSLINGGSLLLINIILGRWLPPEQYALFALSVLALSTVAELSDLGLNSGFLRFAPAFLAEKKQRHFLTVVQIVWRWRVMLSWILTIGGLLLSYPIAKYILGQPVVAPYMAVSFIGIGGVILLGFLGTYLQARAQFYPYARLQVAKGIGRVLGVGILFLAGVHSLYPYLLVYTLVPWVIFLWSVRVLPSGFKRVELPVEERRDLYRQLARFSGWLTVSSLVSILVARVDQVFISNLLGLREVAVYAVAYQLIQLFPPLTQAVTSVLMPKMSALTQLSEVWVFVKRSLERLVPAMLVLMALVFPSQWLIPLLFGGKYEAALPVYMVLSLALLLNLVTAPFSLVILWFNRTDLVLYSSLLQMVINVGVNWVLIPRYGVMGAAYTFALGLVASLVYNVVCSWVLTRRASRPGAAV